MSDLAERLKREIDLPDYLFERHGLTLDRHGMTRCPFHDPPESKASLSVQCKDGVWLVYCFACDFKVWL